MGMGMQPSGSSEYRMQSICAFYRKSVYYLSDFQSHNFKSLDSERSDECIDFTMICILQEEMNDFFYFDAYLSFGDFNLLFELSYSIFSEMFKIDLFTRIIYYPRSESFFIYDDLLLNLNLTHPYNYDEDDKNHQFEKIKDEFQCSHYSNNCLLFNVSVEGAVQFNINNYETLMRNIPTIFIHNLKCIPIK
ncbi:hypothetical protein AGLY_015602 [Aphis glycines]|uniref:Uncharacterized protein n=1 Tax=Aphis glycines TaxID=307491 RepID=A0A6G0T0S8_APHGL|nr:hypothetical protein AGLY_015602 [Aphis glycines]